MRIFAISTFLAVLALGQTGCSTMNNTEKGVGLGAAGGAGVGALVGGKTGAVVGGLVGAGAGGLIGHDIDRQEKKEKDIAAASYAYDQAQPARIEEIVGMAKGGQSESVIITYIRQNRMSFRLSSNDLNYLKQNAVPDGVIVEMQRGGGTVVVPGGSPNPVVVVREPVYVAPRPVVYVDPYGPYYYGRGYRRW